MLQNLLKKKKISNSFNKLVDSKDMREANQRTNIMQAIKTCLDEFGPYQFYDEIIQDYFGGHLELS